MDKSVVSTISAPGRRSTVGHRQGVSECPWHPCWRLFWLIAHVELATDLWKHWMAVQQGKRERKALWAYRYTIHESEIFSIRSRYITKNGVKKLLTTNVFFLPERFSHRSCRFCVGFKCSFLDTRRHNHQPLPPHLFLFFFFFFLFWVFYPFYYLTGQSEIMTGEEMGDDMQQMSVCLLFFLLFFLFLLLFETLESWNIRPWHLNSSHRLIPTLRIEIEASSNLARGPFVVFLENTWSDTGRFLLSGEEAFYPVKRVRPEIREEEYGGDELFWGGGGGGE